MSQKYTIALLLGDGIGPEVIKEAVKVLRSLGKSLGIELTLNEVPVGGAAYETELPINTLIAAQEADAVLLGAVGGPKWEQIDFSLRPERALLGLLLRYL
jgi:3-isopropylmalate dehydrogenase